MKIVPRRKRQILTGSKITLFPDSQCEKKVSVEIISIWHTTTTEISRDPSQKEYSETRDLRNRGGGVINRRRTRHSNDFTTRSALRSSPRQWPDHHHDHRFLSNKNIYIFYKSKTSSFILGGRGMSPRYTTHVLSLFFVCLFKNNIKKCNVCPFLPMG